MAHRIINIINRLEDWFLVLMLSVMVVLAVTQIVYRNFFDSGLSWADPLLRVMVLWVALAGAVIATRTDNHIRIDYFTRYFSKTFCACVQRLVYLFSVSVCALISWHAARFVQMEYEFNTIAFANVPSWLTALIIPLGFGLMAIRYAILFVYPPEQEKRR
jgi:TRAP-type C4-dicarboxylate transport system permease small subunit